jgi:hypothetical protein
MDRAVIVYRPGAVRRAKELHCQQKDYNVVALVPRTHFEDVCTLVYRKEVDVVVVSPGDLDPNRTPRIEMVEEETDGSSEFARGHSESQ